MVKDNDNDGGNDEFFFLTLRQEGMDSTTHQLVSAIRQLPALRIAKILVMQLIMASTGDAYCYHIQYVQTVLRTYPHFADPMHRSQAEVHRVAVAAAVPLPVQPREPLALPSCHAVVAIVAAKARVGASYGPHDRCILDRELFPPLA